MRKLKTSLLERASPPFLAGMFLHLGCPGFQVCAMLLPCRIWILKRSGSQRFLNLLSCRVSQECPAASYLWCQSQATVLLECTSDVLQAWGARWGHSFYDLEEVDCRVTHVTALRIEIWSIYRTAGSEGEGAGGCLERGQASTLWASDICLKTRGTDIQEAYLIWTTFLCVLLSPFYSQKRWEAQWLAEVRQKREAGLNQGTSLWSPSSS